jgi:predicted RNA-binding Zn ribbon-like protein
VEAVERIDYMSDVEPAPGRLALVQAFVNTVDLEHGREMLSSPVRLSTVLEELGLLERRARATRAHLARALALRQALRSLAFANNGGTAAPALEAQLVVRIDREAAALAPVRRDVDGALAELVGIVYTAIADGTWPRLKACRRDVCGWIFYDRSRNHSAVWCRMAVCGNRAKTKAYRSRSRKVSTRATRPARSDRR